MNGAMKMERKRIHFFKRGLFAINKIEQGERGQHLCQVFT